MRLPLAVDYVINQFTGPGVDELECGIVNGIVESANGKIYITQRPSIDIFEDASDTVASTQGRGIYFWEEQDALYIVNDGTLYKDTYGTSVSTSPTAGYQKCNFQVLGSTMILIDPQSDQAFTVSTSDVVTEITSVNFPPKQTPAVPITHGGAVLDKYLFVMGTNGIIYNSNLNDATTWNALDFVEAERSSDQGEYLGRHHDNIVAMGSATIEFLYNAANATGSPLNRRQDISYNIGCASGESVHEEGDVIYFIGVDYSGSLAAYVLENFGIRRISNSSIDSLLTNSVVNSGFSVNGTGFSSQGHNYYILNVYSNENSQINPQFSLVYDISTGLWHEWDTTINALDKFPVIAWTRREGNTNRTGEGILANGDLVSTNDNMIPQDTLLGAAYVTSGYVDQGYVVETSDSGTAVILKARTGTNDLGTREWKLPASISPVADLTENAQDLIVRWSDDGSKSFNTGRTLDTSKYMKVTRCGRFRRRNHEIEYQGGEYLKLEALDVEL